VAPAGVVRSHVVGRHPGSASRHYDRLPSWLSRGQGSVGQVSDRPSPMTVGWSLQQDRALSGGQCLPTSPVRIRERPKSPRRALCRAPTIGLPDWYSHERPPPLRLLSPEVRDRDEDGIDMPRSGSARENERSRPQCSSSSRRTPGSIANREDRRFPIRRHPRPSAESSAPSTTACDGPRLEFTLGPASGRTRGPG
jgi:hypothetical protein